METVFRAGANPDKQRCALTDQANYEFNLREVQAESTVQNLTKIRQQDAELSCENQDCEKPRLSTLTELRSRERAHRETLSYQRDEMGELRKTRRSEVELREEAYQDTISQEGGNILDSELWESHSALNKLTKRMRELQV